MIHRERRIQEIAYLLWEREGRPEGQKERHWHEAVTQYDAEQAAAAEVGAKEATAKAPSVEEERVSHTTNESAKSKAKAASDVEKPKTKAVKPNSAKSDPDEGSVAAIPATTAEGGPKVKSAKARAGKRKSAG